MGRVPGGGRIGSGRPSRVYWGRGTNKKPKATTLTKADDANTLYTTDQILAGHNGLEKSVTTLSVF